MFPLPARSARFRRPRGRHPFPGNAGRQASKLKLHIENAERNHFPKILFIYIIALPPENSMKKL
ncbi:MAG TPA: hypothetical protein DHV71_00470 [Acidaminococcaceae bacterium]|nr:hypothetical protein [Acidaminococcaceae bacterium]